MASANPADSMAFREVFLIASGAKIATGMAKILNRRQYCGYLRRVRKGYY
jgi:hypothetical protein